MEMQKSISENKNEVKKDFEISDNKSRSLVAVSW